MSGSRIVFVTRPFWPLWDGASRTIGAVAAALVERRSQATVLARQLDRRPPGTLSWRDVSVVRLPYDRASRWSEFRWMRSLARWLRAHRGEYDLVYVSGLRHDAYAVLRAVDRRVPVVLRAETTGRDGDCLWHLDARCGRRIKRRTTTAAALVGPSRLAVDELIAAGYRRDRIHQIAHGVALQPERSRSARLAARIALATDHPALRLGENAPLVVFAGRLHRSRGLISLLTAWEKVVATRRGARLWLVGHGPQQSALQEWIDRRELGDAVLLPGAFDEIDTVLAAADVFVLPSPEEDLSVALLEAMAASLAPVACDNRGNRELIDDARQGLLVPPGDTEGLAGAMGRLLDEPELARRLGAAARERVETDFSLAKMVDAHVTLFEGLLHQP